MTDKREYISVFLISNKIIVFLFAVVANMSEAAEAALAAAELDGNRPRKVNPLTIIQVTIIYRRTLIFSPDIARVLRQNWVRFNPFTW